MKIYKVPSGAFAKENVEYLGESSQEVELERLFSFNGGYYKCCILDKANNSAYMRFVGYSIPCDQVNDNEDNLRCPFCGYENQNSFELPDEDNEYECPHCGSKLKYHRHIDVHYECELVEIKEPTYIYLTRKSSL